MSPPSGLRKFFVDRSLGRIQVPKILRSAGIDLITLAEHYGIPADEKVADVEWLEEAGTNGWPVLMKDAAIARNPLEIACARAFSVQCFCLAEADLPAHRMAARFLNSLDDIAVALAVGGPYIYVVHETKIVAIA